MDEIYHGEICQNCKRLIRIQIFRGTGVCSDNCAKALAELPPEARHIYSPGYSGMVCDVMVLRRGEADSCGLTASHPIHVKAATK